MNSFYIYNIRNLSYFILSASILFLILSFFEYRLPCNIFYMVMAIFTTVVIYSIHRTLNIFKEFDKFLEDNNLLCQNDSLQGQHFIDNLEMVSSQILKLISTKRDCMTEHESLEKILKTLVIWKAGNLEERIPLTISGGKKIMIQFINGLNDLVDEIDAYIRESLGAMHALSKREYYRIILKKGLLGSFLIGANKINEGIMIFGKQNTELMKKLDSDVREMIMSIVDETERVSESCKETVQSCELTLSKSADATTEAKNTHMGLTSIEQLALDLKRTGGDMVGVIRDANALSEEGAGDIEKTKNIVMELKTRSTAIHGIVEMIREVAQKTNLLSINAAIEAAKAGKEGHGFRIVADEVRSLAHATMDSAEDIERQIRMIQEAIQQTVQSVSQFTNTMVNISSVSGSISTKMDEQNAVLDDISNKIRIFSGAIQNLIGNVENVQRASSSARSSSQNINSVFQKLNQHIFVLENSIAKSISNLLDK
ncbi:MAG: hypothetical protein HEEMFOPI_00347 [Holosporales bacterium]